MSWNIKANLLTLLFYSDDKADDTDDDSKEDDKADDKEDDTDDKDDKDDSKQDDDDSSEATEEPIKKRDVSSSNEVTTKTYPIDELLLVCFQSLYPHTKY